MDQLRSTELVPLSGPRALVPVLTRALQPAAPAVPADNVTLSGMTVQPPPAASSPPQPEATVGPVACAPVQPLPTREATQIEGFFVADGPPAPTAEASSLLHDGEWMISDGPLVCSWTAPGEGAAGTYPGRRPVPPAAICSASPLTTAEWEEGATIARDDLSHQGVWSADVLSANRALAGRLQDFLIGRAAQSIRFLQVAGKKPEALHVELLEKGFVHQREPLKAGVDPSTGQALYNRRDGSRTADPFDPEGVPHDVYVHPDGGMVRVKPEGVPGNKFRPQPHVSKSVLFKAQGEKFMPCDGADFENEAFKVTDSGIPVPKAATPQCGLRQLADVQPDVCRGYMDSVMSVGHINMSLDLLAT